MATNQPPSAPPTSLIEQYKAYITDLGNVGSRYATANGFYVSTVSALLAILAFARPAEDRSVLGAIVRIVIPGVACLVCWIWRRTIIYYAALFQTKFTVLREMEQQGGLFPTYARDEYWLNLNAGFWLTANEMRVPRVLMYTFAGLSAAAFIMSFPQLVTALC